MNTFELLDKAFVLNRRNAQSLYEAMSSLLMHKRIRFTCNASVVDDNGHTGHNQRVLAVLLDQRSIEIVGVDYVTYRIPYGARIAIGETNLRVEMRSIVRQRPDSHPIRWQLIVQGGDDVVGIPMGDGKPPWLPSPQRMAWLMREDQSLHFAGLMKIELAVGHG